METKRVGIVGISLIIMVYIIFLSVTYFNCSKITPEVCKINKCDFSLSGFNLISDMKDDCCGNKICEVGESYPECTDCPNCDDENKCTTDSYDYNKHECVNKPILDVVCCGNTLCEEGYETNSNCLRDCPNCDDNSRLTADSFDYAAQECENVVTHYFIDDFESGTQDWTFTDAEGGTTTGWSTTVENGNTVLKGTGHNWANFDGREWSNYIFKFRFKRISGSMHVNFRLGSRRRYFINLLQGESMQLRKTPVVGDIQTLKTISFSSGSGWRTMEIRGYGNILNIYVDDVVLMKYKDTEDAILSGRAAFEMIEGEFLIDDVEIKVIAETDVVYP